MRKRHKSSSARRWFAGGAAIALVASLMAVVVAAPGDGTVRVRVIQDYNANGNWEGSFIEPGLAGVEVEVTGETGATQTLTTDGDGLVAFEGAPGSYRVAVLNPDPTTFNPAFASEKSGTADTPSTTRLSSSDEFVTVAPDQTVNITTGFWDSAEYCQTNPLLVGACQQTLFNAAGQLVDRSASQTLFTAPYRGTGQDSGVSTVSQEGDTGTVYGIGYRKQDKRIFAGAYAKRATRYGPGGAGAIYVSTTSGPATVWGVVPNVGSTAHTLSSEADLAFSPAVGRESLGDLDISENGDHLQVVNLFTREVLIYDASTPTMEDPLHTIDVSANPGCSTATDWRPFALGERHGVLYVGGVCSAETTGSADDLRAIILTFDVANGYAPLGTVMDQPLNYKRGINFHSGCPAASTSGQLNSPWSETVPCTGAADVLVSQPLMSDIVVETDGSLVIGFRNRFGDLYIDGLPYRSTNGQTYVANQFFSSGDINKACLDAGSGMFVLDANGACGISPVAPGQVTGEYFTGDRPVITHGEATFGGLALARGERGIATTSIDPYGQWSTQGYLRVDRETGQGLRTASGGLPVGGDPSESTYGTPTNTDNQPGTAGGNSLAAASRFAKGQGMADLEVLCDQAPIQIGNRIWNDTDANGIQDAGEPAIAGVTVNLYDADGNLVATTVTNSRGEYYFDSRTDGIDYNTDYVIRLDHEADYEGSGPLARVLLTQADQGSGPDSDRIDSDGNIVDGFPQFSLTTGGPGAVDHTIDFGFHPVPPAVSVGDFVWADTNRDGIQDAGEPGIPGVVLVLTGPDGLQVRDVFGRTVGPVTTDADGLYSFDDLPVLPAGQSYTVRIDAAASADALKGYTATKTGEGTTDTDSSTGSATSRDDMEADDRDDTLDFGFVRLPSVSVGDYVWLDDNRDGIQDGGEDGIEGVVLVLTGPDGKPVRDVNGDLVGPATTDANGAYSFDNLPPLPAGQSYTVTIDPVASAAALSGLAPTLAGVGGSDTDSSTGSATSGDLVNDGDRDDTLDFGFVRIPKVSVGDYVWFDDDGDGIQDAGEDGIEGVSLILLGPDGQPARDVNGVPVAPVTTDANGAYRFDNLPVLSAGQSYTVVIDRAGSGTALDGLVPTKTGEGTPSTDSSTGSASSGDLTSDGDHDGTLDFGFVRARGVSVGDFVWADTNGNGVQNPGEPGIPGVVLVLTGPDGDPVTDLDGNAVGPVTTDASGSYIFENLPPLQPGESYTVTIDTAASAAALAGYTPTQTGQGTPATDSSTGSATSRDGLEDGDHDPTLDFGFIPPAPPSVSVGDLVWLDDNRDGIQDGGEDGIPGVVLVLTGPDGKPVYDVFGNLVGPATTNGSGLYSFDDLPVLPAGQSYTVTIDPVASAAALSGLAPTLTGQGTPGTDSSTGSATSGDLTTNGARDDTLDFGFVRVPKVSVGNLVWVDSNRDGIQDAGEPGIPGVVLVLTGPDGLQVRDVNGDVVGPVTTDGDGLYRFDNLPVLPAGQSYTVTIDAAASAAALAGYTATKTGEGTTATDSSTGSATSGDLTTDGAEDLTLDFGFVTIPKVSVGDFVWLDGDGNGIQDAGEPGIEGVVLRLTGPDGLAVRDINGDLVGAVVTDADGKYSFDNLPVLPAGESYTVTIDPVASAAALKGLAPTQTGQGTPGTDSSTGSATSGDLVNDGDRDDTLDFGFRPAPRVSVGDFVWYDENGNGVQNAGEPGIPGVVLVLTGPDGEPVTDVNGDPVGPVTTDADGRYSFDNLPVLEPGQSYTVTIDAFASVTALTGYAPTQTGQGTPGTDSSTGSATSGDLVNDGDRDSTLDFGFVASPGVAVGGVIWRDTDRDGVRDPGEPGIKGVVLRLLGPDGNPAVDVRGRPVPPATTNAQGEYIFLNLPTLAHLQGYTVVIDQEASKKALKNYRPTQNPDGTTSNGTALSSTLGQVGDSDLTLDFGFILIASSSGALPGVGSGVDFGLIGLAAALLVGGVLMVRAGLRPRGSGGARRLT